MKKFERKKLLYDQSGALFASSNKVLLLTLLDQHDELYGSEIYEKAKEIGSPMTLATIYGHLKRMEEQNLVSSRSVNESGLKRGLNKKRFYKITGKGSTVLSNHKNGWLSLWNISTNNVSLT